METAYIDIHKFAKLLFKIIEFSLISAQISILNINLSAIAAIIISQPNFVSYPLQIIHPPDVNINLSKLKINCGLIKIKALN